MSGDHIAYSNELRLLLCRERDKLDRQAADLARVCGAERDFDYSRVLADASVEIGRARDRLQQLYDEVDAERLASRGFNHFLLRAGPAFRASVAARCLLVRHTPPLAGAPPALEPSDDHRRHRREHQTDYARSGDWVFADFSRTPPIRIEDHGGLHALGRSIAETLYPDRSDRAPLLFSSGMGALNTVLDYMLGRARLENRRVVVGARSWLETRYYLDHMYPGAVDYVDERDTGSLRRALEDPAVLGICLEPLVNHFDTPVVDLDSVLDGVRFGATKILLLDTVHTPEFDPVGRYFPNGITPGLCVITVVSGVKFLQAGWDLSKSGLACFSCAVGEYAAGASPYDKVLGLRSVSGRVPSREEAELADIETPQSLKSRLGRIDRNVAYMAEHLQAAVAADGLAHVSSPWLPSHPDHGHAISTYGTGGRFLYVLPDTSRFDRNTLLHLDRTLANRAAADGIPLISVNSFGLAVPHTGVLTAVRPEGPILRISPGSTDFATCVRLVQLCADVLRQVSRPVKAPAAKPAFLG